MPARTQEQGSTGRRVSALLLAKGAHPPAVACPAPWPARRRQAGHELYKHRKATVEPVFAQNKFNRNFRRFQRRGRAAARSEWRLQAAVHNLLKLHSHWISPATA